ncbi:carboxymuconolactone decarboxylase family protein [Streptomyces californicus]|uniref:carboxymuconolactone decarboxylase family protein n=1 Tax=Streptomyces californicus TaxID=67351 RepID=UPI0033FDD190
MPPGRPSAASRTSAPVSPTRCCSATCGSGRVCPPRDRGLVAVIALIALCRSERLGFHLVLALDTGLSNEELSRAVTRPASHAGCPNAVGAAGQLRAILADAEQPRAPP